MRLGHARRDLTPEGDIYLIGYRDLPNRLEPATGMHDDVFGNALLFQDGDRELFVFSADVLEFEEAMAEDVDDAPTGAEQADVGGYTSPSATPGPGDPLDDARPVVAVSPEAPPPPHTAPDGGTLRSSRAPGFTEDSDRRQQP